MVTATGYNALRWTFCSTAIVLTLGRFYLRWQYFKRVKWDDIFNGLALGCLIAYFATSLVGLELDYSATFLQVDLAAYMLLWTALYLVKASFLALYWSIFRIIAKFRMAWWIVAGYTFLTYWPIILSQLWQCGDPSKYADPLTCSAFSGASQLAVTQAGIATALHASSDILILAMSLFFVNMLHISKVQKFSVAAVFAIVIIDIIMGVLRNVAALCFYLGYDTENSYAIANAMETCEPGIAVIVCALPAYRVLLSSSSRKRGSKRTELQRHAAGMAEATPRGSAGKRSQASETESGSFKEVDGASVV